MLLFQRPVEEIVDMTLNPEKYGGTLVTDTTLRLNNAELSNPVPHASSSGGWNGISGSRRGKITDGVRRKILSKMGPWSS